MIMIMIMIIIIIFFIMIMMIIIIFLISLKRSDRDRPEEQVLMRALRQNISIIILSMFVTMIIYYHHPTPSSPNTHRDFNTPKIVADDTPVFLGLISDLFPNLDVPRKRLKPTTFNQMLILTSSQGLRV